MCAKERGRKALIWKERLKRHIPILKWFPLYKKKDFISDMIAGVTVGLTMIPQSVAYANLAGLSPEYGLYSSFMGSLIYVIFGTIKEVSIGPTSLMSLLTLEFIKDLPIEFLFLLTFLCGFVQFILGLLKFGFIVNFISVPVTTSFQSATALIIISSQLKDILGLPRFKSGRFINNVLTTGGRLHEARTGDVALSIFCCIFILTLRKLKDLRILKSSESNKTIKKTLWFVSIGRNAVCVFLCSLIGYFFTRLGHCPFKLSGSIPAGLPPFQPLQLYAQIGNETLSFPEMVYQIGPGLIVIPLIGILANVTIAKAFSVGIPVDATQEMLTLGLCNMSGTFVGSMPICGAFTRSAVSKSSGVRTPLAGLFTGTLIILVLKFLTPYFVYIPKATLASVLICAVIFMIDWKTILLLWKVNKRDFFCSVITFSACLLFGVQMGLLLGVALNVGYLLYFWAKPSILIQVKALLDGNYYLVTPDIGLYFPAIDLLRNEITKQCIQNIPIVIDCLHFKGIDYTTALGIKEIGNHCQRKEQTLLFSNMSCEIYNILRNSDVKLNLKRCDARSEELNDILFHSDETEFIFAIMKEESDSTELKNTTNYFPKKSIM